MKPATRNLLASLLMFGAGLGSADTLLAHYAQGHFVPNQVLRSALAAGDGCVVTIGDSRIAAGIDPAALASTFEASRAQACVASLGIGAVGIEGQTLALRAYLSAPRSPRVVVLGAGPLLPADTIDPSDMAGNAAEELAWSRAADVTDFFPNFPLRYLDPGLRFSIARTNAIQSYASLVWIKVQGVQSALIGNAPGGPANRFGLIEDMQTLARGFATAATVLLQRWAGRWRNSPWFETIRTQTRASGAVLVVVHVPVREIYRRNVNQTALWKSYETWLRADLASHGDVYVDLSGSLDDGLLEDGVHANALGARLFSRAVGDAIAAYLATDSKSVPPALDR
jgi:hypothetical protein